MIRHALAGDRGAFAKTGKPDDARPITAAGRRTTRESLPALRFLLPRVDIVATSALTRAAQTADIIATAYPSAERETVNALTPGGRRKELVRWLRNRAEEDVVAIVGHDPDLGALASWLLSGRKAGFVDFEKGGVALLDFERRVGPGRATIVWSIPPRALVRLARSRAVGGRRPG